MDWEAVKVILNEIHCKGCDGYGCDHPQKVEEALAKLKALAGESDRDDD